MAYNNNNKVCNFVLFLLIYCVINTECVYVMQQNDACGQVDGTWRMIYTGKDGINVYFVVKKQGIQGNLFEFSTPAEIDTKKLPFPATFKQHDHDMNIYLINPDDFIQKIYNFKETSDDNDHDVSCRLKFKDGTIFERVKSITKVHLICMNHLDVGYNTNHYYPNSTELIPGYIVNVLNWYFQDYFPRAARLGDELRKLHANETFIYTTHPWLVNLYLDCPTMELSGVKLQCPSKEQVDTFRRAVWIGDITWHAGPFNTEPESANADLFSYSLTLSKDLDDMFGIKRVARTVSNRDVPGWSIAAVPHLMKNDIEALSIGVNPSSAPPDVPSPNVWKYGDYSIISYWHKGGYPLDPGPSPQKPGGLSRKDCQFAPGLDEVLCFAFRLDNSGPPDNITEIQNYYKILRYQFPGAKIQAAKFEDFTKLLIPIKNKLPVVAKEIGDTWIQGPASDPIKMSHYRTISRLRSKCLREKRCDPNDKRMKDMGRMLIKLPEHTYGLAMNYDWRNWSNVDFQPMQYTEEGLINDTKCWLSHREFNEMSIKALKKHPLAKEIRQELKKLTPKVPDFSKYSYHDSSKPLVCRNGMVLKFGPNGDLVQMRDKKGREWASKQNPLATIKYRTYNTTDFDNFAKHYSFRDNVGIWKPGLSNYTTADSRFWSSPQRGAWVAKGIDPCKEIYVRIITLDATAWWKYGAPTEYLLKYSVPDNSTVDIEYQFFNKPSTRMPESLLLYFQPMPKPNFQWYFHKVGYLVDATQIVNNGSQYVHAVDEGVAYFDKTYMKGLFIETLDVATLLVETKDHEASPFPIPLAPMKSKPTAMAFNIYNNIWETNFIFWYPYQPQDSNFKARFRLKFT